MNKIQDLNLRGKKYIIFDMDGTLIDSIGVWNITDQKLIEEFGNITIDLDTIQLERDTFLHSNQDSDIYVAYCEYLNKKYGFSIQNAEQLLKIRWDKSSEVLENEMDFKPDVVELISKFKGLGFTLVLATMTTQVQLDIYSKKNKKMLKQMDISQVFDLITRKEDVINKKPNPEIYNMIMQHYDARPDECLIFEDSYTGVLASKNAGIEVVNVYDKYADLDRDKINAITDYSIANYRQFIDYLEHTYGNPEGVKVRRYNNERDR
ncbi:MAG: HAD family phosphatase [Bacilli bacterium]|nr:HAD family phosphatase [Bacilli bacterium]